MTQQNLSAVEEERGDVHVLEKSEMQASHSMGPSSHGTLVRDSSQEHTDSSSMTMSVPGVKDRQKTFPRSTSMGSEASSVVSEKVCPRVCVPRRR